MTRRLGGIGSRSLAALASLSLAGALACGFAMTGCGGDNGSSSTDSGVDGGGTDATGMDVTTMPDTGAPDTGAPDTKGPDAPMLGQCATPTFNPNGGTVAAGATVTLTAAGLPSNGFIYYTTDMTTPTHGSKAILSGQTITISATEPVYAIAYAAGGCNDSNVAMANFTVQTPEAGPMEAGPDTNLPQCGPPTLNPNGGTVLVGSTVTITPPAGFPAGFPQGAAAVYYTTDGTVPSHMSPAYAGPIQLTGATMETLRAIANYPGVCTDSTPVLANYTITQPEAGTLTEPLFNPASTTSNNDFLVHLTDASATATICFTLGAGTTPTCTSNATSATCTGTSQTYNAGAGLGQTGSVTINGGVTDANGAVTVNAIACQPGDTTTAVASQTYTLKVATPTMQGPAPSTTLTFAGAPYAPTLASATTGSTLRYTNDGTTTPTCNTGTLLVNGQSQPINPGALAVSQNVTYMGIGCKAGYAPSDPGTFGYGVVLPAPTFVNDGSLTTAQGTGTYDRALTTDVAAVNASNVYACYSTTATAPACGAGSTCSAGTKAAAAVGANAGTGIAVTTTGTTLTAIACAPAFNASVAATATYTLQLDAPGLNAPGCLAGAAPGSCITAGVSAPTTTFSIPANQVGAFTPHVEEWNGTPPAGSGAWPGYQFVCAMKGGTPACGASGCTTGTLIASSAANFQTAATVSLGTVVAPGDSWSVIGCPGTTSPGFLASNVTTVVYSGPGQTVAPTITPAGGTFNSTVGPTITNNAATAVTVCYTTDGTAPTCTGAGTGCTNGTQLGGNAATLAVLATRTVASVTVPSGSGGAGYTTAPTVTIAAPPAGTGALTATATSNITFAVGSLTLTAAGHLCGPDTTAAIAAPTGPGPHVTATASVVVDATNKITSLTLTNGGAGYIAAPTVTITGCGNAGNAATATATLAASGQVASVTVVNAGVGYVTAPAVSFAGGGGAGAAATANLNTPTISGTNGIEAVNDGTGGAGVTPVTLQANATQLQAVACTATTAASPAASATYNFTFATPTVVDTTANSASVINGSTLPLGHTIQLATTSNFTTQNPRLCYTLDGTTPACTAGGCAGTGTSVTSPANVVTTTTTWAAMMNTLQVVACDRSATPDHVSSAVYSAALNLQLLTPTLSSPGGTYLSAPTETLTTTAGGGVAICYTTTPGATPTCNAGTCTNGTNTYAGPFLVTNTGADIKAVSCNATYASPTTGDNTLTLNVAPIVITNITPACPGALGTNNVTIGLDCSTDTSGATNNVACSTATDNSAGPTAAANGVHAFICYTTDGSSPGGTCQAAGAHGAVFCFDTGAAGTTTHPVSLSSSTHVNAIACLTNGTTVVLNNSATAAGGLAVTFTPYTNTPTFTGAAGDFTSAAEGVAENSAAAGNGFFTYDGTNVYFGVNGYTAAATTLVTVYLGDATASGAASAGPVTLGSPALPANAGIQYLVQWHTDNSSAPTVSQWNNGTSTWNVTAITTTVMTGAGPFAEFSIPLSSLTALAPVSTLTALGAVVTAVPAAPMTAFTFPGGPTAAGTGGAVYADWYDDVATSCLTPNQQLQ